MKKLSNLFIIFAMASVAFLSSCGNDDEPVPGPTLSFIAGSGFTTGDVNVNGGTPISVIVLAEKGDKDMKEFVVMQDNLNLSGYPVALSGSQKNSFKDTITFNAPSNAGTYTYTFKVTSNDDQVASKQIKVTVAAALTETTGHKIYNQLGTQKGAYNLVSGIAVSTSATDADLQDITSSSTGTYTASFEGENGTTFQKDNSFDYANATSASVATAFTSGTNAISNAQVGDIYLVKLRGGSSGYAVIKITAVQNDNLTGVGNNEDYTEFSLKK